MKRIILALSLTAAVSTTLLAVDPTQKENRTSVTTSASSSGSTGKATITIEVNGKKETREVELGNGTSITVVPEESKPEKPNRKPWLGVASTEISDEVRAQLPVESGTGLLVRSVVEGSPAAQAGLEKNDVLFKFDDQILANASQLKTLVGTKKEGDTVRLTYFRKGQQATLEVKIATHEGGDLDNLQIKLGELMPGAARGYEWVKSLTAPLNVYTKGIIVDNKGNILTENRGPELDAVVTKLESTLREAGVDNASIEQTRRALQETAEAIQKAAGNAEQIREQVSREVKKAIEQAAKAVEKARDDAQRAHADATKKP
ncbi:MAG: hypothetical protein JWL59_729 [Chthoniobacteraceae bacterium]|nr:hypothetical protein [Chthoniobacteraceae bacterium]